MKVWLDEHLSPQLAPWLSMIFGIDEFGDLMHITAVIRMRP